MVGERLQFKAGQISIYVAGRGPRVLEVGGEVGDGVLVGGLCSPRGIEYALECIRRGAERRERDASSIDIGSWVTCHVTDDRADALERLRPVVAHIIGGAPETVLEAIGLERSTIAAIKASYREGGSCAAAPHVTDDAIDALAIVGDGERCAERIAELARAGVTQFIQLMPPGTVDRYSDLLRLFASDVMDVLRQPTTAGGLTT